MTRREAFIFHLKMLFQINNPVNIAHSLNKSIKLVVLRKDSTKI